MEQLVSEIEVYAAAVNLSPGTVVQRATTLGGGAFGKWKKGEQTCTMATAEKVRGYMRQHPAPVPDTEPETSREGAE